LFQLLVEPFPLQLYFYGIMERISHVDLACNIFVLFVEWAQCDVLLSVLLCEVACVLLLCMSVDHIQLTT